MTSGAFQERLFEAWVEIRENLGRAGRSVRLSVGVHVPYTRFFASYPMPITTHGKGQMNTGRLSFAM